MLGLREHQQQALDAAVRALSAGGRAQVVMATGTGKTLVGIAAARRLTPVGTVAVLVPSLALLAQTLQMWRAACGAFPALAVCSADPGDLGADLEGELGYLGVPVTTEPAAVADWLAAPSPGPRVVFATYHSSPRLAEAFAAVPGLAPLDLVVFDEAHRTATDPFAPFATALHDVNIPAVRRLFLTATPRIQVGDPDDPDGEVFAGMSDESVFGARVYSLGVAEAIGAGMLSDYRVVVVGVTDAQVHKLVLDNAPLRLGPADAPARTLAVQIALADAARAFDLRRVLVFHGRVAASRLFSATLPATIDALPDDRRPDGYLTAHHIDGQTPAPIRAQALADLDAPENAGWTVVSNVRVLGEGVDCPSLDAVVFAGPREGQIDVVQAVGRALRPHPSRDQPSVVLLPVYLAPGENGDLVAEASEFRNVWQILRALRDHDEQLGAQMIAARRAIAAGGDPKQVLPDRIEFRLPVEADAAFLAGFTTRLLDGVTRFHEHGYGRLLVFVEAYGHACPDSHYIDDTMFRLGAWTVTRRRDHARGILEPEFAAELEALPGWTWNVFTDRFDAAVAAVTAFAAVHGHASIPRGHIASDGLRLGPWVRQVRVDHRRGRVAADRVTALERISGWTWSENQLRWQRGLDALAGFDAEYGHLQVPAAYQDPDGFTLGEWCSGRRKEHRADTLAADKSTALAALPGWSWTAADGRLERGLNLLRAFAAEHGNAAVGHDHVVPDPPNADGFFLGKWVGARRREYQNGALDPEIAAVLRELPGWQWDVRQPLWERGLHALNAYVADHGDACPSTSLVTADGYRLGAWVNARRSDYAAGTLFSERITVLEALPRWVWNTLEAGWSQGLDALNDHVAEHGHAAPPGSHVTADGFALGAWVATRRQSHRQGRLSAERAAELQGLVGWTWDPFASRWERGVLALRGFADENGHANPPRNYPTADGFALGDWANARRTDFRNGKLTPERVAELAALPGWTWEGRSPNRRGNPDQRFAAGLAAARAHAVRTGSAAVPPGHITSDGFKLGHWAAYQRTLYRRGELTEERAAALEALPGWRWSATRTRSPG